MNGPELKQLRADLGDAVGRRLSTADMAKICGLAPKNGADTWRKWEEGDGPSGPIASLVWILAYAVDGWPIATGYAKETPIKMINGAPVLVGDEITVPVLRRHMRAEILRRLSA